MKEEEEENDEWGGTADYDRNGGATTASSSRTVLRISAQDRSTVLVNVSGWPLFCFVGFAIESRWSSCCSDSREMRYLRVE